MAVPKSSENPSTYKLRQIIFYFLLEMDDIGMQNKIIQRKFEATTKKF